MWRLSRHQSPSLTFVSRYASTVRRYRGYDDTEERVAPHVAVKDTNVFRHEADKLLVKIESALRPMKKYNEVFNITLTPRSHDQSGSLTLELAPDDGTYSLKVDDETMRVVFQSATSGQYSYVLSASTGEWVDEKDGHLFVGLLVRDLIRQCNGLPAL
jgi:frataxin-like iron-binding protein CyaY